MTMRNKQELIKQVVKLLNTMITVEESPPIAPPPSTEQVEMFTIKECAQQIAGLSEHTVRQLVLQNKLPHIRTGQGKRGKILIPKSALLEYLRLAA
ncbi:MAG: helix-turn-helix domain-containing protein [Lachnospiraceae bacterium]|nr:helix-turn-helix domain-containing protein [Ruminococcus sp.]MCM1276292.1 helix-turn-helix domain-containing protein [Lachnospiraceae bacterium]